MKGWIGVDLDGTLAMYDGWRGVEHVGDPVALMLGRVKEWLDAGVEVRIFTARVSYDGTTAGALQAERARAVVQAWCERHLGRKLEVTCVKDYAMVELWDDRVVRVECNTGLRIK